MFSIQSVDQLAETLISLEVFLKGSLSDGKFWPDGRMPYTDSCLLPQDELEKNYNLLRGLKVICATCGSLSAVLEDKVQRMQGTLLRSSYHHGLMSLPGETFTYIIELLGTETDDYKRFEANKTIRQLSFVSKDFRAAVLGTLSLWTRLNNNYCQFDGFKSRILLAKEAPLSLALSWKRFDHCNWKEALRNALSHRKRIQILNFDFEKNTEMIMEEFPSVTFPLVQAAAFTFSPWDDADRFFATWAFPNITRLELHDAVPSPGLFEGLTVFMLKAMHYGEWKEFFPKLMEFLRGLHCLRTLSLDFLHIREPPKIEMATIRLLSVTSFSLSNCSQVFKTIETPNVKDFCLLVQLLPFASVIDCAESFSLSPDTAQKVTHLCVLSKRPENEIPSMTRFLNLFRNLHALEIGYPDFLSIAEGIGDHDLHLDQLRTLHVLQPPTNYKTEGVLNRFTDYPEKVRVSSPSLRDTITFFFFRDEE